MSKKALEKSRQEALSSIEGDRLLVERMAQRPRPNTDTLDRNLLNTVLEKLGEIRSKAELTDNESDLEDLIDDAELQGLFAAYFCPEAEVEIEGELILDQIKGWGIPKSSADRLSAMWQASLKAKRENAKSFPGEDIGGPSIQHSMLFALFEERDSWGDYVEDYNKTTLKSTKILSGASTVLFFAAIGCLHLAHRLQPLLIIAITFAGLTGSCVSVMQRMPSLEVSLSGELDQYALHIFRRIGIGLVSTIVGCALLALIPLSIQSETFAEVAIACSTAPCSIAKALILIGVPMLLGFSERTLPIFEQKFFGSVGQALPPNRSRKRKI